tara:strand:+ start:21 stop:656 length:636 start_codon:yes stop_codon:yes gene_type:complete
MSKYVIFHNKKNQSLVYYACAKNANTSAKFFFAQHTNNEKNFIFISDKIPKYLQKNEFKNIGNLENFFPNYQPFDKIEADFKCCIIRNPIKRFLSTYKNRILYHKDLAFRDLSIDMILEKLLNNNFDNKHFLPQVYFLGKNLNYYSFYSDVSNLKPFVNQVNDFFGKKIEFPKMQIGGSEFQINLSKKQVKIIEKIYNNDFELYDLRNTKN